MIILHLYLHSESQGQNSDRISLRGSNRGFTVTSRTLLWLTRISVKHISDDKHNFSKEKICLEEIVISLD